MGRIGAEHVQLPGGHYSGLVSLEPREDQKSPGQPVGQATNSHPQVSPACFHDWCVRIITHSNQYKSREQDPLEQNHQGAT